VGVEVWKMDKKPKEQSKRKIWTMATIKMKKKKNKKNK